MRPLQKSGVTVGNGAAINIECGFIPHRVEIYNATDGTPVNVGFPGRYIIPFSDGGDDAEIVAGEVITGATSGATARIKEILLYSGTWEGGDAAGFFVVEAEDLTGTFGSEAVVGATGGGDATVTANFVPGYDVDTEVAADNVITPYFGVAGSNSKGFTIPVALATEAKALAYVATRDG